MSEIYVGVTVSNGEVYHLAIQTELHAPSRPKGPDWTFDAKRDVWINPVNDTYIDFLVAKNERSWAHRRDGRGMPAYDAVTVISWRRLSAEDHDMFNKDRFYRACLVDNAGKIEQDIMKARECHRNLIRWQRASKLEELDYQWTRAVGQRNQIEADRVEAERQRWRDMPADPRIDLAQTVAALKAL